MQPSSGEIVEWSFTQEGMPAFFAGGPVVSESGEIISFEFKAFGYIKELLDSPEFGEKLKEACKRNYETYASNLQVLSSKKS